MKKIFITILCAIASFFSYSQKTILYCGNLIDCISNEAQKEMTIVVDGGKIISVEKGYKSPSGSDKVIDLKNKTVLPGLMDMHVHLEFESRKGGSIDQFIMNPADYAFNSVVFSERTLMAGFTTVRDLGRSEEHTSELQSQR